ncbi:MAG: hypothetical protein AAGL96_12945 [Pseudomonadota bacterium]
MSFLPYAPVSSKAWFASITGSTALHGLAITAVLTSSVAMLPEPTTPAVREPEYEITLEIIDADIIELEDFEPELEVPEDAVALDPEDRADALEEVDEQDLLAEEDAEALLPDDTALEAEPEVLEAEPEPIETAEVEEIIPEEEPLIQEEDLALLEPEPEPEPLVPEVEVEPEAETLLEPEPEPLIEPEETLPEPEPQIAEALTPIPEDDPDDLTIDDLSLVDDTVINPLAESVAPAATSDTALAPDVVVPDVIAPEPQIVEEDIAALVLPEPEPVLPETTAIEPEPEPEPVETVALPIDEEPATPEPLEPELETEPEISVEPDVEAEQEPETEVAVLPDTETDTVSPPVQPRAQPIANPSPAALQIGALLQRIRATPAPQCALALPRRAGGDGVGISFIGATPSDLDTLATRILDGFDDTPAQTREILDPRQCAVLDAVRQTTTYPASRIGLALESTTLNSGDSLQARVLGSGGLFLTLVLIDDNGVVQDLARFTTLDGNDPVIDAPVARSGPARDTRQVMVVLGSPDQPIDLSGGIGLLAQDAFAALPADVLENALFGLATFDVR